jgi:hypothetical protein
MNHRIPNTLFVICLLAPSVNYGEKNIDPRCVIVNVDHKYSCKLLGLSMIDLISNSENYVNKQIAVTGVIEIAEQKSNLYISIEAMKHKVKYNSISLSFDRNTKKELKDFKKEFNGKYVTVEGTFVLTATSSNEPFTFYPGKLKNIDRIYFYEKN